MKFCEECGAQLEDDMRFCDECGTPVTDYEEVPAPSMQTDTVTAQIETTQTDTTKNASSGKNTGGSKKKVALFAGLGGVLVLAVILLVVLLPGKDRKEKDTGKETVNQESSVKEDTLEKNDVSDASELKEEKKEPAATKAVAEDKTEESDGDVYPLLDEFISVVCSYSDPPSLEGEALDNYFKGLYDSWVSGEDFTNIVIGADGHLINTSDFSYGDPLTGNNMFRDATYGVYTIVGKVGNLEYGFRVTKEKSVYAAELVYVNDYGQFFNALEYTRDGVFMDEGNEASGVINENTGEWVKITFVPYEDGECWFTFEDFYNGTKSVIVDEILPADCVSFNTFDNYQEYYTFLWN